MKRFLRWIGFLFAGLVLLVLVAAAVIHFMSERVLKQRFPVPALSLSLPTALAELAEGQRLAGLLDCFGGCHGPQGEGRVMFEAPMVGRVVAPNLHAAARRLGANELAVLIRHGIRPDGRSLMIMPSEAFHALTDQDLGRIVAFMKGTAARSDGPVPDIQFGPLGRVGLALGKFQPAAQLVAYAVEPPKATSEGSTHGRYLSRIVCAGCHGTDLRGLSNPEFTAPDLRIVGAYSPQAFSKLMRNGVSIAGKDIVYMKHLAPLADTEVGALYAYLHTLQ